MRNFIEKSPKCTVSAVPYPEIFQDILEDFEPPAKNVVATPQIMAYKNVNLMT